MLCHASGGRGANLRVLAAKKRAYAIMAEYTFTYLDGIPPLELRGNHKGHWAIKAGKAKRWRAIGKATAADKVERRRETLQGEVRLSVLYWHSRRIDLDNFLISLKPFIDGLVDAGVLEDDVQIVEAYVVRGDYVKGDGAGFRVTLQELPT